MNARAPEMEKNSPVFVIRSLFEHGYSPAEAKDTVNLFQNPPNGELILDAVFFSGIHKTLDNEHIDALMALTPAEKIEHLPGKKKEAGK